MPSISPSQNTPVLPNMRRRATWPSGASCSCRSSPKLWLATIPVVRFPPLAASYALTVVPRGLSETPAQDSRIRFNAANDWHDVRMNGVTLTSHEGVRMGDVIRFVSKADLERARLVREARANYESVFPTGTASDADKTAP